VAAFCVNGVRVEMGRTSDAKSHADLVRCTRVPPHTQICFVDDALHPAMMNERVYYIRVHPYYAALALELVLARLAGAALISPGDSHSRRLADRWGDFVASPRDAAYDEEVSREILRHLREFFDIPADPQAAGAGGRQQRHTRSRRHRRSNSGGGSSRTRRASRV
jgi:hypothetical protein